MKSAFYIIALATFCAGVSPLAAAQVNLRSSLADSVPASMVGEPATSFDPMIEDLPLMQGMHPLPNEATLFVTPQSGRIVDSVAEGTVDLDDVYVFYARSLPHLGWRRIVSHTYLRDKEVLTIDGRADGKLTTVRFSIKPEP